MYQLPLPHKCDKCGHEAKWTPHDPHSAPVLRDGTPICPECWEQWLRANFGTLKYSGPPLR